MGEALPKTEEHWTYADYKTWPDDERWELIHGVAYNLSAPSREHQRVHREIFGALYNFLKGKPCELYSAPFDVLLPEFSESDDEVDSVVQPDIVVYCDRSKLTVAGARGGPDVAVEILSPSTSRKDLREKFDLYQDRGVREYWVVDPGMQYFARYDRNDKDRFAEGLLVTGTGKFKSLVLQGFEQDLGDLFAAV